MIAKDAGGNIICRPAKDPKTVYDPKVMSNAEYLQTIKRIGEDAYFKDTMSFVNKQENKYYDPKTGLNFSVRIKWFDNTTPVIDNVYLVK